MRRLTEIRDVVTNLVASETARGSLEEEVTKSVATGVAAGAVPSQAPPARGTAETRHGSGAQLPGRGGRDTAAEPTRATPARTTQRAADTQEELPGRSGAAGSDSAPAKSSRSTSTGGGAHASGARQNGSPD
jgi:hypothetical protein